MPPARPRTETDRGHQPAEDAARTTLNADWIYAPGARDLIYVTDIERSTAFYTASDRW